MTGSIEPSLSTPRDEAILQATRELLVERGARGLTIEAVAERAGVAKTTIYRRWASRHELALAVVLDLVRASSAVPDLGDARRELIEFLGRAVHLLGTSLMGPVMQGLVSELASDDDLATAFRERVVAVRVGELARVLDRGVARGQIRGDVGAEHVHELLFGPVYYRLFLSGNALDDDLARRIVDAVYPGIVAPPGDATPSGEHRQG
jgi:AcrR family transcriptional regulator